MPAKRRSLAALVAALHIACVLPQSAQAGTYIKMEYFSNSMCTSGARVRYSNLPCPLHTADDRNKFYAATKYQTCNALPQPFCASAQTGRCKVLNGYDYMSVRATCVHTGSDANGDPSTMGRDREAEDLQAFFYYMVFTGLICTAIFFVCVGPKKKQGIETEVGTFIAAGALCFLGLGLCMWVPFMFDCAYRRPYVEEQTTTTTTVTTMVQPVQAQVVAMPMQAQAQVVAMPMQAQAVQSVVAMPMPMQVVNPVAGAPPAYAAQPGVAVVAVAPPAYAAAQPMRGPIAVTAVPMPAQPAAVVTVTATPQSPEAVI